VSKDGRGDGKDSCNTDGWRCVLGPKGSTILLPHLSRSFRSRFVHYQGIEQFDKAEMRVSLGDRYRSIFNQRLSVQANRHQEVTYM